MEEFRGEKGADALDHFPLRLIKVKRIVDDAPTIDAIPVEWLRKKAEENSHYAEPYFAFAYVLHEWQQTKSIEELQAESEMRDWKAEQEAHGT
jgi:hypothetical protein